MRMFIAVKPDEKTMQALTEIQDDMKEKGISGRFTDPANLHLTLVFIGEYGKPEEVMKIMAGIPLTPVTVHLCEVRKLRDLYAGVFEENSELSGYVTALKKELRAHGVPCDEKNFLPHVTLVRKAKDHDMLYSPEQIPSVPLPVQAISLMKSERGEHGMVYTETGRISLLETKGSSAAGTKAMDGERTDF